jgi:methyl-accepting chemotaxis protein
MALVQEDIAVIQEMIAKAFAGRPEANQANVRYELELRERIVRVEEELKHQRELMLEGFNRMDKRFEQLISEMNARFAQVDKRFEQVDKRFEQVDKRFEQMEKRFEQVDRRFEIMTARIDRFMVWSFATTLTVGGIVIAVIKYLP